MKRITLPFLLALTMVSAPVLAEEKSSADCEVPAGGAVVRAEIHNIRSAEGNLRAQIYSNDKAEFLKKGKKLVRIEVPALEDDASMCVPLPAPGRYALVILHDRNANGKSDFFSEGFGFSNNPKLGLSAPDHEDVVFDAPPGETLVSIDLQYMFGKDKEQTDKRRKLRRS
ncbi:DUF2141 domain-containing protein [Pseudokordiimonas caeni]|uniref:DUF2141 domain-containing protein n=1 Tax=Pseudokordiimonas caeni TaxID=2997908 RepID=UPI00281257B9|nr:DUF2141 domain-containing protein [Pseudokordiimonas caeni]